MHDQPLSPAYQCRVEGCDWDAVQGHLCVEHERRWTA